jgi:hypothetical protein
MSSSRCTDMQSSVYKIKTLITWEIVINILLTRAEFHFWTPLCLVSETENSVIFLRMSL